ncbi:phage holin family protein [Homoserinibacter sp. GY 40078]|uniref:phage holin family protein n=1 Tax=Homoserinibacter sp. GY 40078 TaxID=2603275 RepID=UPI0011CB4D09|nr:phage holin family protein [Homoserinibacter sp. GY 40078]TXK18944.1 phage holin family protein [Homoserinibacter sp. GY 40078]
MRFLLRTLINAFALWLSVFILTPHVEMNSWDAAADAAAADQSTISWPLVWTYLLVALIFGIVNGIVGTVIRIVAFPLYILTLGLISLIVNGLLYLLVAWISTLIGFGLSVEGFWWGVLGALVLGVIAWLIGIIFRPLTKRR